MTTTETYNLLAATVSFREAYRQLQQLYNKSTCADFTEMYPLGMIDLFDTNTTNAIVAWLNCHATKLINALPDRIINPACVACLVQNGICHLTPSGACSIDPTCIRYPYITYDKNMLVHFLKTQSFDSNIVVPTHADDTAVRTLYHNLLTKLKIQEDVK